MSAPPAVESEAGVTLEAPEVHRVMRRAVLVPLVSVALLVALLGWEIRGLVRDHWWLTHTERVLSILHHAQGLITDHETALRAHLLVGEPMFLEPYRAAERDLPTVLSDLETETADNPSQGQRIAELRRLYEGWKSHADLAVASPSVCEPTSRERLTVGMHQRKAAMDEIRALVQSMVDEERRLMQSREVTATRANRIVLGSSIGLALLLVTLLIVVFRRWLTAIEHTYRRALDRRVASEASERQARTAAEALAAEILAQSRDLEGRFTALRDELAELRGRS